MQNSYSLSDQNPQIVFVCGGPGSGKKTQCERLVRDYHFYHISIDDLVRDEIKKETPEGLRFKESAAKGGQVLDDLVVNLILMQIKSKKSLKYLIDGFPQGINQALIYERKFKEIEFILNLQVSDEILKERLLSRGQASSLADDNELAIMNQINTFHGITQPVLDFYENLGKVCTIDGSKEIDEVFKKIEEMIKPNIIFMYGPPCIGKSEISRSLSDKTKYMYINMSSFKKQHGNFKSDNELVNKLMNYLENAPQKNFIIDDFFEEKENVEIFLLHFCKPWKVFHFDFQKYFVNQRIVQFSKKEKERLEKIADYEKYIQNKSSILSLIQKQDFFFQINNFVSVSDLQKSILLQIKPLVLYSNANDIGLQEKYIQLLQKERYFINIDVDKQISLEISRGTVLGNKMKAFEQTGQEIPWRQQSEMIQKILFMNPTQQRKFIISNLKEKNVENLQKEFNFSFDFYVNFTQGDQNNNNDNQVYFKKINPLLDFYSKGKYIEIIEPKLEILDFYINTRPFYGFVLGPQGCGKTTISKYIANQYNYQLIDWEQTIEMLKVKLGGEEGPLEEISYVQLEKYFYEKMQKEKDNGRFLFDGWHQQYSFANFQAFLNKMGLPPTFLVFFQTEKEAFTQKYKVKNEIAELQEEDIAKIDEILNNWSQYENMILQISQQKFGMELIILKGKTITETQKEIKKNSFFSKKLILVNNYIHPSFNEKSLFLKTMLLNFCFSKKIAFIDIIDLQKIHYNLKIDTKIHERTHQEYQMRNTSLNPEFPSNYTPKLIIEVVQNYLKKLQKSPPQILIYGYPSGDTPLERSQNELMYPRASDEIFLVEKELGAIRMLCVLTDKQVHWQIQDQEWELQVPEKEQKNQKDDEKKDDGEEIEQKQEDDGENNVKKFNIYDYQWTKSDGIPKTVPQWFNKIKKTIKKHVSLLEQEEPYINGFNKLTEFLNVINDENNPLNQKDQDYNKCNIFVQFRYENVEEETEKEPERIPFKFIEPVKEQQQVIQDAPQDINEDNNDAQENVPFPENMQEEQEQENE
ncbi:hypothetical protein IMG5_201010 [Ichthyophthirius multifiliis]|uniref:P-loop containing nucleoside triphosphate hydrolase n=1 Tax=Ichthyophthirius multifiliis TaxID=5932 RepID=G0R5T9_ICHMU|nr:hypothetical protein IMG5_201010 [Ichthyophthirius multifiliis]EGR27160.1 hypothetical protein IMG5_201010 [Ichthyophthirius multifiliis]|eukprot:XP_004024044.1 hypothetical protein IMG5_201010 [Ichthyophthirius multifiliis]